MLVLSPPEHHQLPTIIFQSFYIFSFIYRNRAFTKIQSKPEHTEESNPKVFFLQLLLSWYYEYNAQIQKKQQESRN